MMYCSKCGSYVPEDSAFCSKCGATVNAAPTGGIGNNSSRTQALNVIKCVWPVFDRCKPIFREYTILENEKANLKKPLSKGVLILMGIGVAILLYFGFALSLTYDSRTGVTSFNGASLLFDIAGIGLAYYVGNYVLKKKKAIVAENKTKQESINVQQNKLLAQIDHIYNESNICGLYPQDYLFEDAIAYCESVIESIRADSIKEAINLYEDNLYKTRMEELQKSTLATQREAADTLKGIEKETNKARKAAQFSAVANVVTAYNTRRIRKDIER